MSWLRLLDLLTARSGLAWQRRHVGRSISIGEGATHRAASIGGPRCPATQRVDGADVLTPEIYLVASPRRNQRFFQGVNFVVRTTDEPRALVPAVRAALRDIDRDVIIDRVQPLSDPLAESVAQPRFATATLVVFAMLALTLASVGLFGVLSYAVSRRGRELGVRAALGASRSSLRRLVLREGLVVTVLGVALGMVAAVAVTRLMQGALFGVTPLDPISFAIAPLVLLPAACAACLVPALRAARVGPADALRE